MIKACIGYAGEFSGHPPLLQILRTFVENNGETERRNLITQQINQ